MGFGGLRDEKMWIGIEVISTAGWEPLHRKGSFEAYPESKSG